MILVKFIHIFKELLKIAMQSLIMMWLMKEYLALQSELELTPKLGCIRLYPNTLTNLTLSKQFQSPTDLGVDGVLDYETCGSITCYSNGGAVQNLFSLKNETSELIHELKESLWISRATRAVILDFAVYNANVNLFCVVKLIFEFPAVGGVIPSNEFMTVKLIR